MHPNTLTNNTFWAAYGLNIELDCILPLLHVMRVVRIGISIWIYIG